MEKELWEQIEGQQVVRQSLSQLRQEIKKDQAVGKRFRLLMEGKEQVLIGLLHHEDAKTRKNAALLMGDCPSALFLEPLLNAYEAETQLFVRGSYLQALQAYDCTAYADWFQEQYGKLSRQEETPENRKHREEELRQLSALLRENEGIHCHEFRGLKSTCEVVLMTNRTCPEITAKQVEALDTMAETEIFPAGVIVRTGNVHWRNQVRTYRELLFRIKGMERCPADPEKAAEQVAASELTSFLEQCHKGSFPFYFRIELRNRMEADEKAAFIKKMAVGLESRTGRKLVNAVSDYEIGIRLIENKEGNYLAFVKLFTLEDGRFTYRKEVTAQSMKPVNAAVMAALAEEYLKEDARVLDPFCGVGTMLIERHKAVRADTSYGIDYLGEAIEKAKVNTKAAGQLVHYVHKNFFDFRHEYSFDEIFTEMPYAIGRRTQEEIKELYREFFPAARCILGEGGMLVLYTRDRAYVRQMAVMSGFVLQMEKEVSRKDGAWVMVLRKK